MDEKEEKSLFSIKNPKIKIDAKKACEKSKNTVFLQTYLKSENYEFYRRNY